MAELDSVRPGNAADERTRHGGPPVTPTPADKPRRLGDFEKAGSLFSGSVTESAGLKTLAAARRFL